MNRLLLMCCAMCTGGCAFIFPAADGALWVTGRLSGRPPGDRCAMELFRENGSSPQSAPPALVLAIEKAGDDPDDNRLVLEAAIDAGSSAVPYLERLLSRGTEPQRILSLVALAYVGGDDAIRALQNEFGRRPGIEVLPYLSYALGSRGNPDDRAFLIRSLAGEANDDDGHSVVSAALSLGVLRAAEAVPALTRTLRKDPGTSASQAAETALSWMTRRKGEAPLDLAGPDAAIIAALLENGVPGDYEADEFVDDERGGTWVRRANRWSFRPGVSNRRYPSISIDVHSSPDSQRALVSIGLGFGLKNGSGYDYVLRKISGRWAVQSVMPTWVS